MQTDLDFHLAIARIAQNPIFTALHDTMAEWLSEQRRVSSRAGAQPDSVFREHRRIHDAILGRHPVEAMAAMEDHLASVARNFWGAMMPPHAVE